MWLFQGTRWEIQAFLNFQSVQFSLDSSRVSWAIHKPVSHYCWVPIAFIHKPPLYRCYNSAYFSLAWPLVGDNWSFNKSLKRNHCKGSLPGKRPVSQPKVTMWVCPPEHSILLAPKCISVPQGLSYKVVQYKRIHGHQGLQIGGSLGHETS